MRSGATAWRCWARAARSRCAPCCTSQYPSAEILLFGIEEPLSRIHAPNESVDPGQIERAALAEARFLLAYASANTR